jgi:YegS/Rv2252/BmrU family lipid kinase
MEIPGQRPVRRARVIWNPVSGLQKGYEPGVRVCEVLEGEGVEVEIAPTEGPGHATELARQACRREWDVVVAVGGDGTVNEVLNGLEGTRTSLATVPSGTANMLARELTIPLDATRAARLVSRGRRRRMDAGRANGRRFLMVVGVGWDAAIVNEVAERRRGHLGRHRYLLPIARTMWRYDFPVLEARVDGEEAPRPACLAYACNTRNYGGWFTLAPRARPDDGRLDFLVVREGRSRNYVRWILGALLGTLPGYREVDYFRGRRIRIESEKPVPYQVDGDPGGTTPVVVELEENALEVIVP